VVAVDGERIQLPEATTTLALHKPRGVVSTLADPERRPTVRDLIPPAAGRLYPVGRLDINTTGILLLTNDGALAHALLHPRREVARVYQAKVRGAPGDAALTRLRRGVRLEDGKTAPAHVRVVERLPTKSWLEVTVHEGRQHLVRRMCDAVGHPVEKLVRVRFGPIGLGTLPPGAWRELGPAELQALARAAGLKRAAAAGGAGSAPRGRGTPPTAPPRRPGSPRPRGARGAAASPAGSPPRAHPRSRRPRP
jgi:23S rRNA pseudouridine2605 synthase